MAVLIDNFNRANANLEASTTASGGGTWVHDGFVAGAAIISSNALAANTTDGEGSLYSADIGSVDQVVSVVLKNTTANSFVVLRCTDRQNYVGVRASGANLQIFRRVAGSFTQVYSAAHSITANDVIEARVSGTQNIEVLRNGSSLVSMSIGATLTGTRAGVHARQAVQNPFIDDISAQPLAAAQTITGALFNNSSAFYAATVETFYPVTGTLYSDADTFYSSTVATTYAIAGSLYSDPDTFYAATILAQQDQTVSGTLFANDNAFFSATVAPEFTATSVTSSGRVGTSWAYKTLSQIEREKKAELARIAKRAQKAVTKAVGKGLIELLEIETVARKAVVEATPRDLHLEREQINAIAAQLAERARIAILRKQMEDDEDDSEVLLLVA